MEDLIEWLLREKFRSIGFVDCETECIKGNWHVPELSEACIVIVEDFSKDPHVSEIVYVRNPNIKPCFKKWSTIDQNVIDDEDFFRRTLMHYSREGCLIEYSADGFDEAVLSKFLKTPVRTKYGIYTDEYGHSGLYLYYLDIKWIIESRFNYEYTKRKFFGKYLHLFETNDWHTAVKDALALAFSLTMHFHLLKWFNIDPHYPISKLNCWQVRQ